VTPRPQSLASLLALGILVAALGLLALFATMPFVHVNELGKAIAERRTELLELRNENARESELRKENRMLAAAGQDAKLLLLKGETTGIAGANLQKMMSGLVLANGGTASSFQILPAKVDGNLMRIPMSLSISVDIDGLRDIIHGLETGMPLIFIDDISIHAERDDFRAPDPHHLGPLSVTLQVSGFAHKNGAS
jgi:general secretion pathway protein M